MMCEIHPTALVHECAKLGPDVRVGPYAVIGKDVTLEEGVSIGAATLLGDDAFQGRSSARDGAVALGKRVTIGAHCRLTGEIEIGAGTEIFDGCRLRGPAKIGASCQLFDGVIIGNPGQFPGRHARDGTVEVGDGCVLREGVTVAHPVLSPSTALGRGCYLMAKTHIDHDCRLGIGVKTGTGVTLGGSVDIDDLSYIGMNAVIHQGCIVGAYAMIGMNGAVMRHVPSFATLIMRRFTKVNRRGIETSGGNSAIANAIESYYRGSTALEELESPWSDAISSFLYRVGDEPFVRMSA